jgi:uncharacterized protein YmfQ (DUF2313 family)
MPQGALWEAKNISGSNMQGLMYGMSRPMNMAQQVAETLSRELDINRTVDLIDDWETSVGLPDDCMPGGTDIESRRNSVIERLRKVPTVTLAEMQSYINSVFPDKDIQLSPGRVSFSYEYSFEYDFMGNNEAFVLVVEIPPQVPTFELGFEYDFTSGVDEPEIRCVLDRIIPANVILFFKEAT